MSWYDVVKVAGDAVEAVRSAELNAKFAEVRMEMAKLAEENAGLRDELTRLRETTRLREALEFRDDVYWLSRADGESDGPYCQRCWDGSGKLVRLTDGGPNRWGCTVCKLQPWRPGGRERYRGSAQSATRTSLRSSWRT